MSGKDKGKQALKQAKPDKGKSVMTTPTPTQNPPRQTNAGATLIENIHDLPIAIPP